MELACGTPPTYQWLVQGRISIEHLLTLPPTNLRGGGGGAFASVNKEPQFISSSL